MNDQLLLFLVLFLLLSIGGIALIAIGLSGIRKTSEQRERECVRASGTVVDVVKRMSLGRGKPLFVWYPAVAFQAEGQMLRYESREGYLAGQFTVGERVDILYDADDPSRFHLEKGFDKQITGHRVTALAGILWIVIAGIAAFLASR